MESAICEDGSVLAFKGPMLLNVLVVKGGRPDVRMAESGISRAFSLLDVLGRHKAVITGRVPRIEGGRDFPTVVRKMIGAVSMTGDRSLTPLAAVAGAVSEEVADFLFRQQDVSKVLVNNGGDIAVRLKEGEVARVGVNLDYSTREVSHILTVSRERSGITTSGLGGRSFTKGIASAVVVRAETASLADALSTLIGNRTNVDDPLIVRERAEEAYPDTDIPGQWVTMSVGDISGSKIEEALDKGMQSISELHARGLLFEALISVKGKIRMTEGIREHLRPV